MNDASHYHYHYAAALFAVVVLGPADSHPIPDHVSALNPRLAVRVLCLPDWLSVVISQVLGWNVMMVVVVAQVCAAVADSMTVTAVATWAALAW